MAIGVPVVLTQGADTVDAATFTTASVTPSADHLLILACVNGDGSNVPPSSVTGLGLTWTLVGHVENSFVAASIWVASTGASPSSGTLTLNYPQPMDAAHWHLIEIPGAEPTIPQFSVYPAAGDAGQDQNPSWPMDSAPASGSGVLLIAAINSDTATLSASGNFTEIGVKQSTLTTNLSSTLFWDSAGPTTVGFNTSAAAPRKASVAVEVAATADSPELRSYWFYDDGTTWVDVSDSVYFDTGTEFVQV